MGDLVTLLIGAALGFVASIMANAVTGPILSLASRYALVRGLAYLPFVSDRRFAGRWQVIWKVDSAGYSSSNSGETEISSCLSIVAFSASSTGYGRQRTYLYVGRVAAGVVSGRWYDADGKEAYYGHFQLRLAGTENSASGKWIGWANDGTVKEGDLLLERLEPF